MTQHKEAFALMMYRSEKTGRIEWLWNSRDGVTPFCISDAEDGSEMRHAEFFRDVPAPLFVPPIGSRIFVDLTETNARIHARRQLDAWRCDPTFAEHPAFKGRSDEDIIDESVRRMLGNPGTPDIVTVNRAMQEQFLARIPAPRRPCPRSFA